MPGRIYTAGSVYSYGFNGQMKSDEISGAGNHNTAEYWEYDTRSGRRWNLDPKPGDGISPYSSFNGNPIWFSDVLGDSTGKPGASSGLFQKDNTNYILPYNPVSIQTLRTGKEQQTVDFPIVPMQIVLNDLAHQLNHLNDAFTYFIKLIYNYRYN